MQEQRASMINGAAEDTTQRWPTEDSRWITIFGANADPKLATKLFREDFAEYRRLKNVADFQQGNRR
jgi:hypothetical protein